MHKKDQCKHPLGNCSTRTQLIALTRWHPHSQWQVCSICLEVPLVSADAIRPVTKRAWDANYQGGAAELLERIVISATTEPELANAHYTNQISIIQSSGTGKSRTVDELAKKLFTFPFNLRQTERNTSELVRRQLFMHLTNNISGRLIPSSRPLRTRILSKGGTWNNHSP